MTPPRPHALVFDWDNTLVDTWAAIHHAMTATFDAMGMTPWSFEETRRNVRRSAREAFPELFGARHEEAMQVFYDTFTADHLAKLRARPGAAEMLARLHDAGYDLSVVSNKTGRYLRDEARHLGWNGYFRCLVGATDAARDKPAAEAVAMALAGGPAEALPRREVWLVGDTDIDLLCAVNAGCTPVLLRDEPPGEGEFADAPPALHLASCADLAELLAPR